MTLKEQLDAAEAKATDLQNKLTAAEDTAKKAQADADAAKLKADEAAKNAEKIKADLDAEKTAHASTQSKLSEAEKAKADLEEKDTTAGGKAAEQLARNGIKPAAKGEPGKVAGNSEDPIAIWDRYQNADATTQATMREQLGDKLTAAAEAYDAAKAGK